MPLKFDKKELEQMEMYDGLIKHSEKLPYTPAILTKYEREVINGLVRTKVKIPDTARTYADIPTKVLSNYMELYFDRAYPPFSDLFYVNDILNKKSTNFSEKEVKDFLEAAGMGFRVGVPIKIVEDEQKSILSILSNSKYYNDNKEKMKKSFRVMLTPICKLEDMYYDKGEAILYIKTAIENIPKNAKEELENRKKFWDSEKSRDELDFIRISKKVKKLYEAGEFEKGDDLIKAYTYGSDSRLNGVARHTLFVQNPRVRVLDEEYDKVSDRYTISEKLFAKTIIELSEIRKRISKDGHISKTLWERWVSGKYLYRGLPLKDFLKTIEGPKPPEDWLEMIIFEESLHDDVIKYLKGKVSKDHAILSTSLNRDVSIGFIMRKRCTGALLKIDVTKYDKGLDLQKVSKYPCEEEVILPAGTKLKINEVKYNDSYFEIDCVPI